MTSDPKIMLLYKTNLKITGIFGENRDVKTVIREPFANDLALMFIKWTVPLIRGQGGEFRKSLKYRNKKVRNFGNTYIFFLIFSQDSKI